MAKLTLRIVPLRNTLILTVLLQFFYPFNISCKALLLKKYLSITFNTGTSIDHTDKYSSSLFYPHFFFWVSTYDTVSL
ncbi:hypothetical protein BDF20DRAFT_865099 [Mycotypha africana]|uniref:uncharacterized protein n=1 Tax=Mycotypha africana TaxID=64632 RepID=UPI0023016D17|nr:uncharacterized protein BDF20DRAFT_865099 [Mycotypha africana]KAI8982134.1 hypothetical protein BDF20DRAFT_865099 [Mycotypha africana]